MNLGMMKRRFAIGNGQQSDIYEGCITLEFTETFENNPRMLTANNNNVITYLDKLIVDGVEQPIQRNYSYTFGLGEHKVGWKMKSSVIYGKVMLDTAPFQTSNQDNALVTIPANITEIKPGGLRGVPAYRIKRGVICYAETPPIAENLSVANWYINNFSHSLKVPANSVEAYKVAPGWSQYANYIIAI